MGRCNICGQVNGHAEGCPNSGKEMPNENVNYRGEIRCSFCNTLNPAGTRRCRTCNATLDGSQIRNNNMGGGTLGELDNDVAPVTPTIVEAASTAAAICPKCGYSLRQGATRCPACGADLAEEPNANPDAKSEAKTSFATTPVWDMAGSTKFSIGLCGKDGEITNAKEYTDSDIVLGRQELDEGNTTISRQHIHLVNEDGKWYVEDVSSQHQTFLIVKKKTLIENDDILVLGNKFFRFKTE